MKGQYIVNESDLNKRAYFYDYIVSTYNLNIWYPYNRENFINNKFPFVIDFKDNSFWICESITCCAGAAQVGTIKSIDEFKMLVNINSKNLIKKL